MKFPDSTVSMRCPSALGDLILAAHGNQLAGIWFEGQAHQPDVNRWAQVSDHPLLQRAQAQLGEYFARQRQSFDLALDLSVGTAFQQAVWRALLQIPMGATSTYGVISADIGHPRAMRAVGLAIGRNPFSIVVPCHRVVGKSGALTGYAGGLARKRALLQLEGAL